MSEEMYVAQPIEWTERGVVMLDQRKLPAEEISYIYTDYREVAKAIREMVIRGAPAIGVAAAMGVALGVQKSTAKTIEEFKNEFVVICDVLSKTRPTARPSGRTPCSSSCAPSSRTAPSSRSRRSSPWQTGPTVRSRRGGRSPRRSTAVRARWRGCRRRSA